MACKVVGSRMHTMTNRRRCSREVEEEELVVCLMSPQSGSSRIDIFLHAVS